MVERWRWTCPECGRRYDIPLGHDPKKCPKCAPEIPQTARGEPADDPQRPAREPTFMTRPPEQGAEPEPPRSYSAKRGKRRSFGIIVALSALVCFLVLGFFLAFENARDRSRGNGDPTSVAAAIAAVIPHEDPDRAAVRAWLKENLNVPDWEEVRWWPARDIVNYEDDLNMNPRASKPFRLCRLKYRAKNAVGATEIYDQFFEIRQGKADPWIPYSDSFGQAFFRSRVVEEFFPN